MNHPICRGFAAVFAAACLLGQSAATAVTIPVQDDAPVNQTASVVNYNYGHRQWIDVTGATNNNQWSYLHFGDVRDFLPSGTVAADISKVFLNLYVSEVTAGGNIDLYAVSGSWVEGTHTAGTQAGSLTWNSKPASTGSALNTFSIATADEAEYITVDVTDLVKDWITNPGNNHGLVLKPNGTAIEMCFDSKENVGGGANGGSSHAPYLDVILLPQDANLSAVAAGTWTGANSITTLGTISSGTWNGTSIALANGGTGSTTASGARANLGLTIGTNVQAWDADIDDLADGSLTGSKVIGIPNASLTNSAITIAGNSTALGGSITANSILDSISTTQGTILFRGASTWSALAPGSANYVLSTNGAGADPVWRWPNIAVDTTLHNVYAGTGLGFNTTGNHNLAVGYSCLYYNTTGAYNTTVGGHSMFDNTSGSANTSVGYGAMEYGETGDYNVAVGYQAHRTGGGLYNVSIGLSANWAAEAGPNVAVGAWALGRTTTGSDNIGIGHYAGFLLTTGDNNIAIGNQGVAAESDTIRIGEQGTQTATYVAGIYGATSASGVAVYVNSSGQLGTLTSSRRFKDDIADMDAASEAIHSLRPVSFHYKPELDAQGIPQFGLIAEEVAEIAPELVARDAQGDIYTVRYEAVNAMLLNEFQKEHQRVKEQAEKLAEQEQAIAAQERANSAQQKQIEELTAMMSELNRRVRKADKR